MIENIDGTVTLAKDEYDDLIDDQKFLEALQIAGVNTWENYEHAIDIYLEGD